MECQLQNILSVVVLLLCLQELQATVANCKKFTNIIAAAVAATQEADACTDGSATSCIRPLLDVAKLGVEFKIATDGANKWGCYTVACATPTNCVQCADADNCNAIETSTYNCIHYTHTNSKWTKDITNKQRCDKLDTAVNGGGNCRVVTPDHVEALPGTATTFCGNECGTDSKTCKTCTPADCNDIDSNYKYCKTGSATITDTTALDALKYNFCGLQTDKCKRPVFTGNPLRTDSSTVVPGCGTCGTTEKCLDCDASGCTDSPKHADYQCNKWTWVTSSWIKSTALQYCADSSEDVDTPFQICNMPKVIGTRSYASGGCGACKNDDSNCVNTGAKNQYETYKCFTWTFASEKWNPSTEAAECSNTDNTKLCNLPKERNTKTGYTSKGCGACLSSEATTCLETIPGKNAGNLPKFSVIAAFTALVFTLLIQ